MAYGISYTLIGFNTPYVAPTPGFFVGQQQSKLSGYSTLVLSYQSPFWAISPKFYSGGIPAASTSTDVTATFTSTAQQNGVASVTTAISTTLNTIASRNLGISASTFITTALTANAIHTEFADETFAITVGINSTARQNMPIQSTTAITVGLPVDSIVTRYAGASTAITTTITSAGIRIENANVTTAITATLTAAVIKGVVADAQLSIIESSTNQISSLYYVTTTSTQIIAGTSGSIIRGQMINSLFEVISSFIAKVKKANPITDHDTVYTGEVMPRRWYAELTVQRDEGTIVAPRNYEASLATRRWSAILGDRNKFGLLQDTRWKAYLQ